MEMRMKIGAQGTDDMARGAVKARAAKTVRRVAPVALAASLLFAASPAVAGGFTAADIQFLYGKDDGDFGGTGPSGNEAFPMWTFEVANGWTYGDNFFFVDWTNGPTFDTAKTSAVAAYGELHNRLSYSKISGSQIALGPISDFLLAGEVDFLADPRFPASPTYCYGLGVDFKIPGFAYAFVNFFVRDELTTEGVSFQINPVWMVPFSFGGLKGNFNGWIDVMTGEGDNQEMWWQAQPTLLVDVGNFWGAPGKLLVGCEYEYFSDFLGIGVGDVNHPQFVAQWNL
jgi:nucleoside-specific outer membrane channel protein Tsx